MAKRNELSLREKIEMLDNFKKQSHSSQREFAEHFKITRSHLNELTNNKEELKL